jgi:hypothetical protein
LLVSYTLFYASAANRRDKKRKRETPDLDKANKRAHTGYTLYVHENYVSMKSTQGGIPSKEILSLLARQWAEVDEQEKDAWQYKADQLNLAEGREAATDMEGAEAEIALPEPHSAEDWGDKKRPARKAPPKSDTTAMV